MKKIEPLVTSSFEEDVYIARRVAQEPRLFIEVYDQYFDQVFRYIRSRVDSRLTCEDLTSSVFLRALEKIHTYQGIGSLGGWLLRIANNVVTDWYREKAGRNEVSNDRFLGAVSGDALPEDKVLSNEQTEQIRHLINELTSEQRDAVILRYGVSMTMHSIAKQLGKSPQAVRMILYRAIRTLRRRWQDEK